MTITTAVEYESARIALIYHAWRKDQITEDGVPRLLMDEAAEYTSEELHQMARRLQRLSTELRSIIEMRKADVDDER